MPPWRIFDKTGLCRKGIKLFISLVYVELCILFSVYNLVSVKKIFCHQKRFVSTIKLYVFGTRFSHCAKLVLNLIRWFVYLGRIGLII